MGYEIDFLAVGEGERSGDAIALRVWRPGNLDRQAVIVIDGGTKETGQFPFGHCSRCTSFMLLGIPMIRVDR